MKLWILAVLTLTAWAGEAERDWDNLRQIQAGEKIEVVDARMKPYRGTFARYDAGGMSLATKGGDTSLKRDEVMQVSVAGKRRRLKKVLLGAAIGGAAGVALSAAFNIRFSTEGHDGFLYPRLVPAGIGIGAAIGATGSSFRTVYRAPKK